MQLIIFGSCRFGHLSCAASDVEIYLHMLSSDETTELLDTISRSFDASSLSVKGLGLAITTFKVQELLGTFFSKSTTGPPSSKYHFTVFLFLNFIEKGMHYLIFFSVFHTFKFI